jgi:RND family efflux transporter MFP subunit
MNGKICKRKIIKIKEMKNKLNFRLIGFLLISLVVVAEACSNSEANTMLTENKGIPVKVAKLEKEKVSLPVHISGNISASKESRLSFKTGGIIESIYADEGDKVIRGQVLAKLNLKEIQEQVNQAAIGLEKAERDYERIFNLYSDTVATLEKFQNAKSALDIAKTNLNITEYNLKHSTIKAPTNGIILKKFFEENEIASTGNPIFYFASAEESWRLVVGVSDKDIVKLKIGDKATILTDAWSENELNCHVSKIANAPGQYTGLYEIELLIEDSELELKHGFFAKGEIYPLQNIDCFSLPINAIQEGIGKTVIFYSVDNDGCNALRQETQIVAMNHEKVFIPKDKFNDEMMVIVERQKELKHHDKIKIIADDWLADVK